MLGRPAEVQSFAEWLGRQQQFRARVVTAGNHDIAFDELNYEDELQASSARLILLKLPILVSMDAVAAGAFSLRPPGPAEGYALLLCCDALRPELVDRAISMRAAAMAMGCSSFESGSAWAFCVCVCLCDSCEGAADGQLHLSGGPGGGRVRLQHLWLTLGKS